jgi:WD40 repeat protein
MPVTCIRWRPHTPLLKTKNVLISGTADGNIYHWHATSGKLLHSISLHKNQVLSLDYSQDARFFAAGCKDCSVKVYDETTKTQVINLTGEGERVGHANRIFSARFLNENTIVSGGWDNTVIFWDLRTRSAERTHYGPHICGDSIDFASNLMVTGSYAGEDQLILWSVLDSQKLHTQTLRTGDMPCMLYAAQFSKADQGKVIVAGGSGSNQGFFFETGSMTMFSLLEFRSPVYGVDFANITNRVALCCGDGKIHFYSVVTAQQARELELAEEAKNS